MKYTIGQSVFLLDTEFKPVASADILQYDANTAKYQVRFHLHPGAPPEEIWVPTERLASTIDVARAVKR